MSGVEASLAEKVDVLLDRLGRLTDDEVELLAGAWQEEDGAARRRAWTAAKPVIERARLGRLLERARSAVGRWATAGRADYHGVSGMLGQPGDQAHVRMSAAPAVLDAVVAILAGDALDEQQQLALSRPWSSVAGA